MHEFGLRSRIAGVSLVSLLALTAPVAQGCAAPNPVPGRAAAVRAGQENVDGLVAKGRSLLAEGKFAQAQQAFEAAEKLDGATLRTRMWTLRSWLPQGRVN